MCYFGFNFALQINENRNILFKHGEQVQITDLMEAAGLQSAKLFSFSTNHNILSLLSSHCFVFRSKCTKAQTERQTIYLLKLKCICHCMQTTMKSRSRGGHLQKKKKFLFLIKEVKFQFPKANTCPPVKSITLDCLPYITNQALQKGVTAKTSLSCLTTLAHELNEK